MPTPSPDATAGAGEARHEAGQPPPHRICIVSAEFVGLFKNGGIGTSMSGLAESLADHGHDITVLYTRGFLMPALARRRWRKTFVRAGLTLDFVRPVDFSGLGGPLRDLSLMVPAAVLRYLETKRFDIVHLNDTGGEGYLALAARHTGLHFERTAFVAALHSPTEWVLEANRSIALLHANAEVTAAERLTIALADVLWSPSRYLLDWIVSHGFTLPRHVVEQQYVMPRHLPAPRPADRPDSFRTPSPEQRSANISSVVFFGRLEARKGLRIFVEALNLIADELSKADIEVVFLGSIGLMDGQPSDAYIARHRSRWPFRSRLVNELGQAEALAFLREEGRLAVVASATDNSPCTVYEVIENAVAFIAARGGGIPELVHPDDTDAVLFEPLAAALAERLTATIRTGATFARPAVPRDENMRRWLDLHAAQGLLVEAGLQRHANLLSLPGMARLILLTEGDPAAATRLAADLRGSPITVEVLVLRRSAPPGGECGVKAVTAEALLALPVAGPGTLVAFVDPALNVDAGRFRRMAERLLLDPDADGYRSGGKGPDGAFHPPGPGGIASLLRWGVLGAGPLIVKAETFARLSRRPAPDAGAFAGLPDALALAGARLLPYPEAVASFRKRPSPPAATLGRFALFESATPPFPGALVLLAMLGPWPGHAEDRRRWAAYRILASRFGFVLPELIALAAFARARLSAMRRFIASRRRGR